MRRLILFSLTIALSSCARIPPDESQASVDCPPSLSQSEAIATNSSAFTSGDFPDREWWKMFEDPQLNRLIETALSENPTLRKVESRIVAAEAEARVKKSKLFPQIGFNADVEWQYLGKYDFFRAYTPVIPSSVAEYEIDVDFYYQFDFWGKNRNVYQAAMGIARAQVAERENAILALTASLSALYFKLQANFQKLETLKKERTILTRLFELTDERIQNALDATPQGLTSEENLLILNQNIRIAEQKIALAKHMLSILIGSGPECLEKIESIAAAREKPFPMPTELSCNLLARRPDLMAQLFRMESYAHLVGAAKADFYPNIDLYGLAGFDSVFINKLFDWKTRTGIAKPALYLPIFTGGRLRANLRARQAEFEESIYAYNETLLNAAKEVADQIVVLKTVDENLRTEKRITQKKKENRKIATKRYQYALDSLLDVLSAQEGVLREEFLEIKIAYEKKVAAIGLIKALGGGYVCHYE